MTAVDQSSPQLSFDLYVFDEENYDLWATNSPYMAFYEARNGTSFDFEFSVAEDLLVKSPQFRFVVRSVHSIWIDKKVLLTAVARWTERLHWLGYRVYPADPPSSLNLFYDNETQNHMLKGSATEISGKKFNFYVFNNTNYILWQNNEAYRAYHQEKHVTTTSFSIPLSREEALSRFYFVAENPLVDTEEKIKFSATIEWSRVIARAHDSNDHS